MIKNLTRNQKIASSFIAVVIILLAGSYAYIKFLEGKMQRSILPSLTRTIAGEPVNILLLGSDSRQKENKTYGRSDTIVILHYDPKKERAYMVSIPRDSRVYIEGYGYRKINSTTAHGGPNLMVKTVKKLSGLDIHHYVLIDFSGFKNLVDAVGGIKVNVPRAINSNAKGYEMKFSKGWHDMNGTQALNYVRFRHDPRGDLGRIERQQTFFKALSNKLFSLGSLPRAPYLLSAFAENVETDMGGGQLLKYGSAIKGLKDEDIIMTSVPGKPQYMYGASYVILDEEGTEKLFKDIEKGKKIKAIKPGF